MGGEIWLESVQSIPDGVENVSVLLTLAEVKIGIAEKVEQRMNDLILEGSVYVKVGKCHPIDQQHCLLAHPSFYLQILLELVSFLSIQTVHSVFQLIMFKMLEILGLYLQQGPLKEGPHNLKEWLYEIEIDA